MELGRSCLPGGTFAAVSTLWPNAILIGSLDACAWEEDGLDGEVIELPREADLAFEFALVIFSKSSVTRLPKESFIIWARGERVF